MASDRDEQIDEDGNWQADFYDAEHRQRLRNLLAEKDPQRRRRIFDAIEWDAVCEDLMVVIDGLTEKVEHAAIAVHRSHSRDGHYSSWRDWRECPHPCCAGARTATGGAGGS